MAKPQASRCLVVWNRTIGNANRQRSGTASYVGTAVMSPLWNRYDPQIRTTSPAVRKRGVPSMCDYSLQFVASRPARVGDKLVTTQFGNSITRGFAAVGEPNAAVCLLPGTEA